MLTLKINGEPTELKVNDVIWVETEKFLDVKITFRRGEMTMTCHSKQLRDAEDFLKDCKTLTLFHEKTNILRKMLGHVIKKEVLNRGDKKVGPNTHRQRFIIKSLSDPK